MNKRITQDFKNKYQKYTNESITINDLYLYSQMLRKELLSDILEFESLLSNKIIEEFSFFDFKLIDLENHIRHNQEIKDFDNLSKKDKDNTEPPEDKDPEKNSMFNEGLMKNKDVSLYNLLTKNLNSSTLKHIGDILDVVLNFGNHEINVEQFYSKDTLNSIEQLNKMIGSEPSIPSKSSLRDLLVSKSFGVLVDIVIFLNNVKIIELFSGIWNLDKVKINVEREFDRNKIMLENYIKPILLFIKDIRNLLAHEDIPFLGQDFFNLIEARKIKHNPSANRGKAPDGNTWTQKRLMLKVKESLLIIHNKSFYERFEEKIKNNYKLNKEILGIFKDDVIWKKI